MDFITYLIFSAASGLVLLLCIHLLGRQHAGVVTKFDYTHKPEKDIVYYEILSDVIQQMRLKMGAKAVKVAQDIPGLSINKKNGYIDHISENPSKIISMLISRYEKIWGKPISFSLRDKNTQQ
jgi:hypothetical protein